MSFQEKSTALMLVVMVGVYGWYFAVVGSQLDDPAMRAAGYKGLMLFTVLALVALAIVGHVVIALVPPRTGDESDERDRIIDLRGEWIGGYVLGTGALAGLFLAMAEFDQFWIANAILLAMVLSEVVTGAAKLVLYRTMS